jgi:hypothetical protein
VCDGDEIEMESRRKRQEEVSEYKKGDVEGFID